MGARSGPRILKSCSVLLDNSRTHHAAGWYTMFLKENYSKSERSHLTGPESCQGFGLGISGWKPRVLRFSCFEPVIGLPPSINLPTLKLCSCEPRASRCYLTPMPALESTQAAVCVLGWGMVKHTVFHIISTAALAHGHVEKPLVSAICAHR